MIMYPVYCVAETIIIGLKRNRYDENINYRYSYFSLFSIPFVSGLLMIGWNLIFEPIGILNNLWYYPDGKIYFLKKERN